VHQVKVDEASGDQPNFACVAPCSRHWRLEGKIPRPYPGQVNPWPKNAILSEKKEGIACSPSVTWEYMHAKEVFGDQLVATEERACRTPIRADMAPCEVQQRTVKAIRSGGDEALD
jgi:hypothetical protein